MFYNRFRLGFNYPLPIYKKYDFIKFTNKNISEKINYYKQYETRDFFTDKKRKKNFVNYYQTKEFKQYKPNLKA